MSIDAVVTAAEVTDRGLRLYLADRPGGGPRGQRSITITNWPEDANPYGLVGIEIWGGSGQLMVGNEVFAERRGYGEAVLVNKPHKG